MSSSTSRGKQRLDIIMNQLGPVPDAKKVILQRGPSDVVITVATRTPLTKARKGGLKDTPLEELLIAVLSAVREKSGIDPALVQDICVGNVLASDQAYLARAAVLTAGFPATTASSVCNRFCSSGLLAIQSIAGQIMTGAIEVGIAVGAESMSTTPDNGAPAMNEKITSHPLAGQTQQPMGQTSENVAGQFNISRAKMDQYAAESFQFAEKAQKGGWSTDEITPVAVSFKNPKTGTVESRVITADDGIRSGTTVESLAKIRSAFPQWAPSHTTGGNASQITDGAAGVLLMKRSKAEELGLPILGRFVGATVVGLEPRIMGIGPSIAIPKILDRFQLSTSDIDLFEINEAFSSMAVYCVEKLHLERSKVNPRGGAIALGHPLGCTGVRQVVTALSELKRQGRPLAVTSMCVGTGMGMAGIITSEQ
ncbi:3-ketoacyl-CoA thiolase [Exophiala viscosa]|uniref:acetyl-CoA C-acyltransferase n=1 Tax=Exophiala viscosa TaxID=2486360 RepID=A0AAN6DMZ9_9EURO|nr:3-ketoacyl-CoA thiolase [Exophiala viscosa]KAI1620070.1 3-ketoacyl-CoA thiolase [Exophiala viscosa]